MLPCLSIPSLFVAVNVWVCLSVGVRGLVRGVGIAISFLTNVA